MTTGANLMSGGEPAASNTRQSAGEYLTFMLGSEQYGIDILKVQEIRGYDQVTQIANLPAFIKGVINLRGKIVPIVDFRIKFELGKVTYDEFTVVIILNLDGRVVGIVVDGVSDVRELFDEHMREMPSMMTRIGTDYIIGLATIGEDMLILLNIEKLMTSDEMELSDKSE